MTLIAAAHKVLAGAQSGVLENVDEPLRMLNAMLTAHSEKEDVFPALAIINEARKAAYTHHRHLVLNLQQLERSALYINQCPLTQASWQLSA